MKNTIKRFSAVALVIIILLTFSGFTSGYNPKAYDVNNILKTIMEITSKEFNGRAAGTPDGKKTEDYFAAKFKEIGLKPGGDNGTYFQGFTGVRGNPDGPYLLEVVDGSNIIKTYKYGTDYKYLIRYAYSGEVTAKGIVVEEASGNMPKASGEIALLSVLDIPYGQTPQPLIDLYNAGYRGAIVPGGDTLNRVKGQKALYDDTNASKLPRVTVSTSVFGELMDYSNKGYKIHLKTNFVVSPYSANNVIGVLEAAKPTEDCLIISAHMDHVAPDPDGAYFPGALDNASGVSSLLEIARVLKEQNVKPSINIVFAAFNGEEIWLDGSRKYVSSPLYPLQNSKNINLDGIGAKSEMPLFITVSSYSEGNEKATELIDEISNIAKDLKYNFKVENDDSSDHSNFAQSGVPAVTLCDMEAAVYHVPEDTIDNIGAGNLIKNVDVAMNVIGKEAYTTDTSVIVNLMKANSKQRLSGDDRYKTAVAISKSGWQRSDNVILTSGENFPDALVGSSFAYLKDAPILITTPDKLSDDTLKEIQRLGAKNIYILGSTDSVSGVVENSLKQAYNVERIGGSGVFDTAVKIGEEVRSMKQFDTVTIATQDDFPDALAIAPFSARDTIPILFSGKDQLRADTKDALQRWNIKNVVISGGTGVISSAVENELKDMGITVTRLAGQDRYATALEIIKHFEPQGGYKDIAISTGENYPDALAGAVLAAKNNMPIILVNKMSVDSNVADYINGKSINMAFILGGTGVVSSNVVVSE